MTALLGDAGLSEGVVLDRPEVFAWVAEKFMLDLESARVEPLVPSVAGNRVTRVVNDACGVDIVVKELTEAWDVNFEGRVTAAMSGVHGAARYRGHDEGLRVVVTDFVPCVDRNWTVFDFASAVGVLGFVPARVDRRGMRVMSEHEGDRRRATAGVDRIRAVSGDRLAEDVVGALQRLANMPVEECVPGHADTTPENWVMGARQPVLIDLGAAALVPYWWDTAMLTVTLPVSVEDVFLWAGKVNVQPWQMRETALVLLAITADACTEEGTQYGEWGQRYMPRLLDVLQGF